MSDLTETFSVVIRSGLPAREREFLSHLAHEIVGPSGESLLELRCKSINTANHRYLEADVFDRDGAQVMHVHIPHEFVLLIAGEGIGRAIGFSA